MRILHIVAGDLSGGAARGAYWLHVALRDLGVDSMIYTSSIETLNDPSVISTTKTRRDKILRAIRKLFDSLLLVIYRRRLRVDFSSGMFGIDFTKTKYYQEADVIHLHWINDSFVNIKHLSKIKKPIIWTLRDMWALTGGCHHSNQCTNYKIGCGSCYQLGSRRTRDLSTWLLKRKKKYLPSKIKIVGISRWLSSKATESALFREFDVRTIYNSISLSDFFPVEKDVARRVLAIQTEKKIIVVGATGPENYYKGFQKFVNAIEQLNPDKYFLCFFGRMDIERARQLGFEHRCFGFLHDAVSLRLLYSSADVFVAPSTMEAFGKTIAEAMACGTPAVCFDATGPREIVTHKVDGYKAKPFDAGDLADGIEWVVKNDNYAKLSQCATEKVSRMFDSKEAAKVYRDVYKEILKENAESA